MTQQFHSGIYQEEMEICLHTKLEFCIIFILSSPKLETT